MKVADTEKRHFLQFISRIEEEGIVVIDNTIGTSVYYEPFISEYLVCSICRSGYHYAKYDMHDLRFVSKDISFSFPNHILVTEEVSEDYATTLVVVSKEIFDEYNSHFSFRRRLLYEQHPTFHLSDSQYESVLSIVDAMRALSSSGMPSRKYHLITLYETLVKLSDYYRQLSNPDEGLVGSRQRISVHFFDAIVKHYRLEHSVAFYADLLYLSPKYFSDAIKQETGHGAKYWIESYILVEAKRLLRTREDLNMQEISNMLGYEDQTTFCRSFKKGTGMTPTEFRQHHE